jgi:catechol 2,3-dioxygenase-like lactoylglutathione lyase family enzyme
VLVALTPMLRTWDLPGSIRFYTEILGFTCDRASEEWGWALLTRDGMAIMLSRPNAHEGDARPAFTGSLYLRTTDVDRDWVALRDRARVCYPIEDFAHGMREFGIYDNNGYLIQFGQPQTEERPDVERTGD